MLAVAPSRRCASALHSTTRVNAAKPEGDDGGNGVKLNGNPGNLHSLWDGLIGGGSSPLTAANSLSSLPIPPAGAASDLNTQHWIDESFAAAKSTAYKNPPVGRGTGPFTVTAAFKSAAKTLAKKRVALAGARLAKILNDELK
jgi:S1/P1 Nuclease